MLREQGEQARGFLRPREVPWIQGCSGGKGSKLGARGASWGLPEVPGWFHGPRDAQEERKSEGSELGARGASQSTPKVTLTSNQ